MERFISLFLLSFFLFFNNDGFFLQADAAKRGTGTATRTPGGNLKFKLFHRHSPQFGKQGVNGTSLGLPRSKMERFRQLVFGDKGRLHTISKKLAAADPERRRASEIKDFVELPMRSAADLNIPQYFVSFRVGSPSKKFFLIADTASILTWIQCRYKENTDSNVHEGRIFHPEKSRTFKPIPCSSDFCKNKLSYSFVLGSCNSPTAPCSYDYSYEDGTRTIGIFGNDTVKIGLSGGQKIKMTDVLIGCSERTEGHRFEREKDINGILGLGFNFHSFAYRGAKKFGNKFSYCLVDHMSPRSLVNYLVFGGIDGSPLPNMQYTQLVFSFHDPFYGLNVSGISVNGTMLDIPYIWDVNINSDGGTILDSGMSLTYMPKPVFNAVMEAFKAPLSKFKKVALEWGGLGPEYCFNDTGFEESLMPKLVIHFADGAKLEPPVKSYVNEVDDNIRCLAFSSGDHGPMVIGNIMQQNHLWEFDLWHPRLGFAPSTCKLDNKKSKKTNTKA
ncbi:Peptidase A1 [Corchorus olitorius]|uniref:Peptidase A1 n=1 Tax=Corchorus olitorius TaxID=93759 RepID=A0A1R3J2A6_9ROSI|nr:Peptidase A1 [Corchorus olitorius]